MGLELGAIAEQHLGTGVAFVTRRRQVQLAALIVQVLGIIQAEIAFVILPTRRQGRETELFSERRLRVAAHGE
ncbi:hypothetical protein D3C75_1156710 [compost metagenome]